MLKNKEDYKGASFKTTHYHGDDLKKIKQVYKDLRKEANYLGEEGDMVCVANSPEIAFKKFRKKVFEDCGKYDGEYINESKVDDIGIGWLFLTNEEQKEEFDFNGSPWYVSWNGDERSDYEVYVLLM